VRTMISVTRALENTKILRNAFELSQRESEIAAHLVDGSTNLEIGNALFITEKTVKYHMGHIFRKLGTSNRLKAVIIILRTYDDCFHTSYLTSNWREPDDWHELVEGTP
jgi:DNA-binding NarL/FixJ family response regulator